MAGAYTVSYFAGLVLTALLLSRRTGGRLDDGTLRGTYTKLVCAGGFAAGAGWAAARGCAGVLGNGTAGAVLTTVTGSLALGLVYLVVGRALRIGELRRVPGFR
jgi:putative peptidoglycan lipid II flippase